MSYKDGKKEAKLQMSNVNFFQSQFPNLNKIIN